jgi:Cytochrome P460
MMKDSNGRYAGNDLWGDGWGWSWFDVANPRQPTPFPSPLKATSTDYRANCKPCHLPAQASEWIYVDGYPPLRR